VARQHPPIAKGFAFPAVEDPGGMVNAVIAPHVYAHERAARLARATLGIKQIICNSVQLKPRECCETLTSMTPKSLYNDFVLICYQLLTNLWSLATLSMPLLRFQEAMMLNIKLFGTGQACYGDQILVGFPNQQPYLLFCYLLLNRHHPHDRDQLAATFWTDCPAPASRKCLRNALWRLRHALLSIGAPADEYLLIGEGSITFAGHSRYSLDVEIFETAGRYQSIPGMALTPEQAGELEQVSELYVGDLLQGVTEDWCLYDRERFGLLYLNTLSKLMVFHGSQGAYERGLDFGSRILARDNLREKVHREMMRLHWLSGNRCAALAQYQHCAQILHDEMGLTPMPATQLLYQQILHDRVTQSATYPTHTVSDEGMLLESPHALVERALLEVQHLRTITEAELDSIEELIHRAILDTK
jgi:DNA-binding SARP family transcriptional activator